jgi:hypothetical protein
MVILRPFRKAGDRRSGPPEKVGTFPSKGIETQGRSIKFTVLAAS